MEFVPYLSFNGSCEEAMNFYAKTLGATMTHIMRFTDAPMPVSEGWKNKVLHCGLERDGQKIYGSDGREGMKVTSGDSMYVSVDFSNEADIDSAYAAMAEGGKATMALQDTFWGAKFGMCTDKYGINWMFNYDRPKN